MAAKRNKVVPFIIFTTLLLAINLIATNSAQANQGSDSSTLIQPAFKLLEAGETEAAISALETIVKHNPNNAEARIFLANLYVTQNETSKAEKNYLEVIRMNPNDAQAYNNLGLVYLKKGDAKKAM